MSLIPSYDEVLNLSVTCGLLQLSPPMDCHNTTEENIVESAIKHL